MSGATKIKGMDQLNIALNKFAFNLDEAIDDAVRVAAFNVQSRAVKSIVLVSDSGRKVKRGKKGYHTISKEGDAPNSDTGRLAGSVQVAHQRGAKMALVGTNLDYGAILETDLNRAWLEPAKQAELPFFGDAMKLALKKQIDNV